MLIHAHTCPLLQALGKYKKTAGLDIDPVMEAKAEGVFGEGMEFFKLGQLPPALIKFQVRPRPNAHFLDISVPSVLLSITSLG